MILDYLRNERDNLSDDFHIPTSFFDPEGPLIQRIHGIGFPVISRDDHIQEPAQVTHQRPTTHIAIGDVATWCVGILLDQLDCDLEVGLWLRVDLRWKYGFYDLYSA